ncbi:hypothetical protein LC085_05860 [Bacillus tianshenii]|uniref:hypothetical protein n=1 Tax=Sutcliffiella tianshenii TaxID=1463404 RepID=UPI001CD75755|nr:hypothetical protein [Bacillus tianshenii]MCA1319433.1 hypothetical protein [Bacillus tianshenii]
MKHLGTYIIEVLKGDLDSYVPVIHKYEEKISQTFHLYISDKERVEELVMDVFVHVHSKLPEYMDQADNSFDDWFIHKAFHYMMSLIERDNPRRPESKTMEVFFRSLSSKEQEVLILEHIFKLPFSKIGIILGLEQEVVMKISHDAKRDYIHLGISESSAHTCINNNDLFYYVAEGKNKEFIDDHLEFCPACRERLSQIEKQLKSMESYLHPVINGTSYQEKILQNIKPYNKHGRKKKSWKYQLVSVFAIFITCFGFIYFLPQLNEWKTLASNYMSHGEFYNVWDRGTYVAKDKEISLEITNIEVTPLLSRIDYVIETDRELTESYAYTGNHFLVVKPGLVSIKIEENIIPLENISLISTSEDLKKGSLYFDLSEKADAVGHDRFELVLNTSRVGGVFGNWELAVPVEYKKGITETETLELNSSHSVMDTFDILINNLEYSATSNRMEVEIDFTEQEKERILHDYEVYKEKNHLHYFEPPQFNYSYSLVNEKGDAALQFSSNQDIDHYDTDEITVEGMPTTIMEERIFHNYYHDPDSMLATSPMKEGEKLYFQLDDISYTEQIFLNAEFKLEEVERLPLNLEFYGTTLDYATIKTLPEDESRPERYQLKIMGKQPENELLKKFHWSTDPGEENLSDKFYFDSYWEDFSLMDVNDDPNMIFYLEIPVDQALPETLKLQSYWVTYHLPKEYKLKVPLN